MYRILAILAVYSCAFVAETMAHAALPTFTATDSQEQSAQVKDESYMFLQDAAFEGFESLQSEYLRQVYIPAGSQFKVLDNVEDSNSGERFILIQMLDTAMTIWVGADAIESVEYVKLGEQFAARRSGRGGRAVVRGGIVMSRPGWRRDPVNRRQVKFHNGTDISYPTGTPVPACGAGVVVTAGRPRRGYRGYGNVVEIDHGGGRRTLYAHLSRVSVRVGQSVGNQAIVGAVGCTGKCTGPHLHFEDNATNHNWALCR